MKKIAIVNPVFSSEAGPPVIPVEVAKIKGYMKGMDTRCYDLDVNFFNMLKQDKDRYDLVQYTLGGFPFSFPYTAKLPSNTYPFDELLAGDVLLSILYDGDINDSIQEICKILGLEYEPVLAEVKQFLEFIRRECEALREYSEYIFYCNSITSVITTLIIAAKLRGQNVRIIGIGKSLLVPYISQLIQKTGFIDVLLNTYEELEQYYSLEHPIPNVLDFTDVAPSQYYSSDGLSNIELCLCKGCPGRCKFCSIRMNWNQNEVIDKYEILDISEVRKQLRQIQEYFGSAYIHINDCTFNAYEPYTLSLLEEMEKYPFMYSCNLRADKMTEKIADAMEHAHFYQAIVGIESLNEKSIHLMNKGKEGYSKKAYATIKQLLEHKIYPQMNALVFYPEESYTDVEESIRLWKKLKQDLLKDGFDYFDAPVGTLCINYPSEMYYYVMNCEEFNIRYHKVSPRMEEKVPDVVKAAYEEIPYYAFKDQKNDEVVVDKMQYVKEIIALRSNNSHELNECILNSAMKISEQIVNVWIKKDLEVALTNQLLKCAPHDNVFQYLIKCLQKRSCCLIKELFESLAREEVIRLVLLIFILNRKKVISIIERKKR